MSEFQGSIRIASTSDSWGRWWLEGEIDENGDPIFTGPTNQVTILQQSDDSLVQVGIIEDIAPNEQFGVQDLLATEDIWSPLRM